MILIYSLGNGTSSRDRIGYRIPLTDGLNTEGKISRRRHCIYIRTIAIWLLRVENIMRAIARSDEFFGASFGHAVLTLDKGPGLPDTLLETNFFFLTRWRMCVPTLWHPARIALAVFNLHMAGLVFFFFFPAGLWQIVFQLPSTVENEPLSVWGLASVVHHMGNIGWHHGGQIWLISAWRWSKSGKFLGRFEEMPVQSNSDSTEKKFFWFLFTSSIYIFSIEVALKGAV